jgi:hypothetical protein
VESALKKKFYFITECDEIMIETGKYTPEPLQYGIMNTDE